MQEWDLHFEDGRGNTLGSLCGRCGGKIDRATGKAVAQPKTASTATRNPIPQPQEAERSTRAAPRSAVACVNCAHHSHEQTGHWCDRPSHSIDPVLGLPEFTRCHTERQYTGPDCCGPEGRFFQAATRTSTLSRVRALLRQAQGGAA